MTRKIKVLGFAYVAILAFTSLAAAAAQADEEKVHIDANPAIVTGQSDFGGKHHVHAFQLGQSEIVCTHSSLEGTVEQPGGGPEQTPVDFVVTPQYSECEFTLTHTAANIDMNGCKYLITGRAAQTPSSTTAELRIIDCTPGEQIQLTTPLCTFDVGEQGYLSHIVFSNSGGPATNEKDIVTKVTISSILNEQTGAFCPGGNEHQGSNLNTAAETTLRAYQDTAAQEQITENGHQFTRHLCGAQVGMFAD